MPKYRLSFYGRTKGAIGIKHDIKVVVEAPSPKEAVVVASQTHDVWHCTPGLEIEETDADGKIPYDDSWVDRGTVNFWVANGMLAKEHSEHAFQELRKRKP